MIPLGKPELSIYESVNPITSNVVRKFEAGFSNYIEKKYEIAVNSGTIALNLSIKGIDLKKIVIPAFTCPYVLNAASNPKHFLKENCSKRSREFILYDESLSVAENCPPHSVLVPIYPSISEEDVDIVLDSIRQVV